MLAANIISSSALGKQKTNKQKTLKTASIKLLLNWTPVMNSCDKLGFSGLYSDIGPDITVLLELSEGKWAALSTWMYPRLSQDEIPDLIDVEVVLATT